MVITTALTVVAKVESKSLSPILPKIATKDALNADNNAKINQLGIIPKNQWIYIYKFLFLIKKIQTALSPSQNQ